MYIESIVFGIGIIYGFLKPGKEDRGMLIKRCLFIGIVLAIILTGLGIFMEGSMMWFESGIVGIVMFLEVVALAIFFIIGTLIGDFLEDKIKTEK